MNYNQKRKNNSWGLRQCKSVGCDSFLIINNTHFLHDAPLTLTLSCLDQMVLSIQLPKTYPRPDKTKRHGNSTSTVKSQLIPFSFNKSGYNPLVTKQTISFSLLPIEGYGKIVLPFNADVWVPLVQGLRVLLKHPLVPSGYAV